MPKETIEEKLQKILESGDLPLIQAIIRETHSSERIKKVKKSRSPRKSKQLARELCQKIQTTSTAGLNENQHIYKGIFETLARLILKNYQERRANAIRRLRGARTLKEEVDAQKRLDAIEQNFSGLCMSLHHTKYVSFVPGGYENAWVGLGESLRRDMGDGAEKPLAEWLPGPFYERMTDERVFLPPKDDSSPMEEEGFEHCRSMIQSPIPSELYKVRKSVLASLYKFQNDGNIADLESLFVDVKKYRDLKGDIELLRVVQADLDKWHPILEVLQRKPGDSSGSTKLEIAAKDAGLCVSLQMPPAVHKAIAQATSGVASNDPAKLRSLYKTISSAKLLDDERKALRDRGQFYAQHTKEHSAEQTALMVRHLGVIPPNGSCSGKDDLERLRVALIKPYLDADPDFPTSKRERLGGLTPEMVTALLSKHLTEAEWEDFTKKVALQIQGKFDLMNHEVDPHEMKALYKRIFDTVSAQASCRPIPVFHKADEILLQTAKSEAKEVDYTAKQRSRWHKDVQGRLKAPKKQRRNKPQFTGQLPDPDIVDQEARNLCKQALNDHSRSFDGLEELEKADHVLSIKSQIDDDVEGLIRQYNELEHAYRSALSGTSVFLHDQDRGIDEHEFVDWNGHCLYESPIYHELFGEEGYFQRLRNEYVQFPSYTENVDEFRDSIGKKPSYDVKKNSAYSLPVELYDAVERLCPDLYCQLCEADKPQVLTNEANPFIPSDSNLDLFLNDYVSDLCIRHKQGNDPAYFQEQLNSFKLLVHTNPTFKKNLWTMHMIQLMIDAVSKAYPVRELDALRFQIMHEREVAFEVLKVSGVTKDTLDFVQLQRNMAAAPVTNDEPLTFSRGLSFVPTTSPRPTPAERLAKAARVEADKLTGKTRSSQVVQKLMDRYFPGASSPIPEKELVILYYILEGSECFDKARAEFSFPLAREALQYAFHYITDPQMMVVLYEVTMKIMNAHSKDALPVLPPESFQPKIDRLRWPSSPTEESQLDPWFDFFSERIIERAQEHEDLTRSCSGEPVCDLKNLEGKAAKRALADIRGAVRRFQKSHQTAVEERPSIEGADFAHQPSASPLHELMITKALSHYRQFADQPSQRSGASPARPLAVLKKIMMELVKDMNDSDFLAFRQAYQNAKPEILKPSLESFFDDVNLYREQNKATSKNPGPARGMLSWFASFGPKISASQKSADITAPTDKKKRRRRFRRNKGSRSGS